ncbi:hypothetical protein ACI3ET_00070 [Ornithinimicrobium sp. LYQ121]
MRSFGVKSGLADRSVDCVVVSRFDLGPDSFTVVGPITIAQVPGP